MNLRCSLTGSSVTIQVINGSTSSMWWVPIQCYRPLSLPYQFELMKSVILGGESVGDFEKASYKLCSALAISTGLIFPMRAY